MNNIFNRFNLIILIFGILAFWLFYLTISDLYKAYAPGTVAVEGTVVDYYTYVDIDDGGTHIMYAPIFEIIYEDDIFTYTSQSASESKFPEIGARRGLRYDPEERQIFEPSNLFFSLFLLLFIFGSIFIAIKVIIKTLTSKNINSIPNSRLIVSVIMFVTASGVLIYMCGYLVGSFNIIECIAKEKWILIPIIMFVVSLYFIIYALKSNKKAR